MPKRRETLTALGLLAIVSLMAVAISPASAQVQYVETSPGYVNLGMVTSILVTAPSAGSYTVVVVQPNGTEASLPFAPTSAGQMLNATYGNSTLGFRATVNQVGTYNVFVEQGSQVVSSTSFYATNELKISMQMVTGGTCDYVSGVTRGSEMFPHITITYASNGAPMTSTAKGASVTVLMPNGQVLNASAHGSTWQVGIRPNWNYTSVGPWNPAINASDGAGNLGAFKYTGAPFVISPVELGTSVSVMNATSGQVVTTFANGQAVTIQAQVSYPSNAEPVAGFVGLLNSTRGGTVTAEVGWGYYNETSGTFGGNSPGALIATVPLTYSSTTGSWAGQFAPSSLPKLPAGSSYVVVITSKDSASPANTGFAMEILAPGSSTVTTVSTTATETSTQVVQTIPDVVYAALAILLVLGVLIGYIVRVPR